MTSEKKAFIHTNSIKGAGFPTLSHHWVSKYFIFANLTSEKVYHCFYLHLKIRNEVEHLLMFSHFYLISVNLKSILSTLMKILAVLDYFIVYFLLLSLT